MERFLKNLEYLIPLLAGMSTPIKILAMGWAVVAVFLFISISASSYTKNKQKAIHEENFKLETAKIQVNRLIEDFDFTVKLIVEEYPKEINRIKQEYNRRDALHSSMHLRKQYDTAIAFKKQIDGAYKKLTRQIQDIILVNFKKKEIDIIPQMYTESEQIKSLHQKYEAEKKKFEEAPRKLDSQMNGNKLVIDESFQMMRY